MKRSEINAIIREFEAMLKEYRFALPPFLSFTPEEWETKGHEYDEIRDNALGWDITDYGEGNFAVKGLSLITIRNGNVHDPKYTKTYAEKIMMLYPGQISPNHFHWNKMEDIINRGGGDIIFRLWNADREDEGKLLDTDVLICQDGRRYYVKAGSDIVLKPGESLSLYPYYYHEFYIPADSEKVLIGEVSMCNDDNTDNRFYEPLGRFPTIEEDEPPYRLLCNEYPAAKD
ncbi:MAG: D-lyxose/D-mannose family sugar isomerase [Oscillospiraceae bacterium]|nr:D-lyxose/D-mannose family sugar isomerase [Oscillospiraceae bacterium]